MRFSTLRIVLAGLFLAPLSLAVAQQPNSSIERARLFRSTPGATNTETSAEGTTPGDDTTEASSDDSFGKQIILKMREQPPTIVLTGNASLFYTDNAALTPNDRIDDAFVVGTAGITWTPRMNPQFQAQFGGHASLFRYFRTSDLDFEDLGVSAALFWAPEYCYGISFFARYDLIELLDRHSDEFLQDHEFTVGGQKVFALRPNQSFTVGMSVSGGIAKPASQQRAQAAIFASYRWQITRELDAEIAGRFAGYLYGPADRTDYNQVVSANLRYRISTYADVNAFFSFGRNRSDQSGFDYDAGTAGGGIALTFRF